MLIYSTVIINNIIMTSYLKNILNIRYLKSIGSIAQYTTIPITKKYIPFNQRCIPYFVNYIGYNMKNTTQNAISLRENYSSQEITNLDPKIKLVMIYPKPFNTKLNFNKLVGDVINNNNPLGDLQNINSLLFWNITNNIGYYSNINYSNGHNLLMRKYMQNIPEHITNINILADFNFQNLPMLAPFNFPPTIQQIRITIHKLYPSSSNYFVDPYIHLLSNLPSSVQKIIIVFSKHQSFINEYYCEHFAFLAPPFEVSNEFKSKLKLPHDCELIFEYDVEFDS